jgi:hypothetical protein
MPHDPAHQLNRSECQADFTYTITVKTIKIQDTGKGLKSVADDLQAVLRKIEEWHRASIASFFISYRDTAGAWHQLSSDGKQATAKQVSSES